MRRNMTIGTEIVTVTVKDGCADEYMKFETNLTRVLNQMYPYYHLGADIYQSTEDSNTFLITALYNTSLCYSKEMAVDLECFVKAQYETDFPHVESRSVITNQSENNLLDHCYQKF